MTTTGSRITTSCVAWPIPAFDHATAIRRAVPLNCGMSKLTLALPLASSLIGPEKKAISFSVGGLACKAACPPSPPVRNRPVRAKRAVDQATVEVADFEAELALAVIPVVRRRRLVARQVENADIDRCDRHVGVLVGACARHLHADVQRLARQGLCGASSLTCSLRSPGSTVAHLMPIARIGMRLSCASPGRKRVARHIGAGAPIGCDRDIDFAAGGADVGIGHRDQRFRSRPLPSTGRHNARLLSAWPCRRHGSCPCRAQFPAHREFRSRSRRHTSRRRIRRWIPAVRIGRLHLQPVTTPGDRHRRFPLRPWWR